MFKMCVGRALMVSARPGARVVQGSISSPMDADISGTPDLEIP